MNTRTLLTALAGLALAGALALTGCNAGPDAQTDPEPEGQGTDAASAFLACLTAAGVDARINDQGMVLVKQAQEPSEHPDGSISAESGAGGGESMLVEGDDAGNQWVAAAGADYFADDPDVQDAYAACEKEHPDFSQPQFDPSKDPESKEMMAEQQEAALAFAQCARENGFSEIADPGTDDELGGGAIMIPPGFAEADFRALVEACYDPSSGFAFGADEDLGFEPWTILEEFQSTPAS